MTTNQDRYLAILKSKRSAESFLNFWNNDTLSIEIEALDNIFNSFVVGDSINNLAFEAYCIENISEDLVLKLLLILANYTIQKNADDIDNLQNKKAKLIQQFLSKQNENVLSLYVNLLEKESKQHVTNFQTRKKQPDSLNTFSFVYPNFNSNPLFNISEINNSNSNQDMIRDFEVLIDNEEIDAAWRYLGKIEDKIDDNCYCEALLNFKRKKYDEVISITDYIKKGTFRYLECINLRLKTFAIKGDLTQYNNCIYEYNDSLPKYSKLLYCQMLLAEKYKGNIQDVAKSWNNIKTITNIQEKLSNDTKLYILDIIRRTIRSKNDLPIYESDTDTMIDKINRYIEALRFHFDHNHDYLIPINNHEDNKIDYSKSLESYFLDDKPFSIDICKILKAIYDIYDYDHLDYLDGTIDIEKRIINSNICSHNDKTTIDFIKKIYINQIIDDRLTPEIENYIKDRYIDLSDEIKNEAILKALSRKGRIKLIKCNNRYKSEETDNYESEDGSSLSADYFRIFEIELNDKIVMPLNNIIDKQILENKYETHIEELSDCEKKDYASKWRKTINSFVHDSLNLGTIEILLKNLGSEYDTNDPIANYLKENIETILNDYGKECLNDGTLETIISKDNRKNYRIPGSHSGLQVNDYAKRSRELVYKNIPIIMKSIKNNV